MSEKPQPGTARHHLLKAATWLAAAEVVAAVENKTPEQVARWHAMTAMAQAHATLGAAIDASPDLRVIRQQP
jgi:hypothetical protein